MDKLILTRILIVIFFSCTWSPLVAEQAKPVWLGWNWNPSVTDMGGLSTNDYVTNFTFRVYSSTNLTVPLTNWTMTAEWPVSQFLAQGPLGSTWTNSLVTMPGTRFYVMRTYCNKASEGERLSPFSNVEFLLAQPQAGILQGIR